jgi:hypothetical protein
LNQSEEQGVSVPLVSEAPEFYANQVSFRIGIYDVTMDFAVHTGAVVENRKLIATVRMSPQHALVMAKLLMKSMADYEKKIGKLNVPAQHYESLGLSEE